MSGDIVQDLLRRSKSFLRTANLRVEWGEYDLACLDSEQALQLFLKALLLELFGIKTRTHSILEHFSLLRRELMSAGLTNLANEVGDIMRNNREILDTLDESYIEGRYGLASGFTKEIAERCIKTTEQLLNRLEKIRREVKGDEQ